MTEDDKYPEESDRRRFVKGVVGAASLTGVGTMSAGLVNPLTNESGVGGGATTFVGIENTAGPAPRAMPMIPVRIDDSGDVLGYWPEVKEVQRGGQTVTVAEEEIGGQLYTSDWFQYCGVETYPGIQPDADQDNYFRYASDAFYDWQEEEVEAGDVVNVEEFSDYETWGNGIGDSGLGKPAIVTWRSQDASDEQTIPVQIMRVPQDDIDRMKSGLTDPMATWIEAATPDGDTFIAWLDKCTHFCCVPQYKGLSGSANFGAENDVYCQCHQSVYDPFSPVEKQFTAFPRPTQ